MSATAIVSMMPIAAATQTRVHLMCDRIEFRKAVGSWAKTYRRAQEQLYPAPNLFLVANIVGTKAPRQKCLLWFDCPTLYDSEYNEQKNECPNGLPRYRNTKIDERQSKIHRIPGDLVW